MNLPYLARLVCLAFACFFLIHLQVALLVRALVPAAIRWAGKIKPRNAAQLLFAMRLFPVVVSLLLVAGFCVPSYLRLEPDDVFEPVGLACLAASLLGFWTCGEAIFRGIRALTGSRNYVRRCIRVGRSVRIDGDLEPVCVIDESAPPIAIAGLIRPTLVASSRVLEMLSAEQLDIALKHERAHWTAHDNLKRLAVTLAPGILPGANGFRRMEKAWSRFTEWAADDRAVAGDARRSVVLASALVRVARISTSCPSPPVMSSLLPDGDDLSCRVNRLLCAAGQQEDPGVGRTGLTVCTSAVLAAALASAIGYPAALRAVHTLLESLIQ